MLEHVFIGNLTDANNLERLKNLGIGHIINLAYGTENVFPNDFEVRLLILISHFVLVLKNKHTRFTLCKHRATFSKML